MMLLFLLTSSMMLIIVHVYAEHLCDARCGQSGTANSLKTYSPESLQAKDIHPTVLSFLPILAQ